MFSTIPTDLLLSILHFLLLKPRLALRTTSHALLARINHLHTTISSLAITLDSTAFEHLSSTPNPPFLCVRLVRARNSSASFALFRSPSPLALALIPLAPLTPLTPLPLPQLPATPSKLVAVHLNDKCILQAFLSSPLWQPTTSPHPPMPQLLSLSLQTRCPNGKDLIPALFSFVASAPLLEDICLGLVVWDIHGASALLDALCDPERIRSLWLWGPGKSGSDPLEIARIVDRFVEVLRRLPRVRTFKIECSASASSPLFDRLGSLMDSNQLPVCFRTTLVDCPLFSCSYLNRNVYRVGAQCPRLRLDWASRGWIDRGFNRYQHIRIRHGEGTEYVLGLAAQVPRPLRISAKHVILYVTREWEQSASARDFVDGVWRAWANRLGDGRGADRMWEERPDDARLAWAVCMAFVSVETEYFMVDIWPLETRPVGVHERVDAVLMACLMKEGEDGFWKRDKRLVIEFTHKCLGKYEVRPQEIPDWVIVKHK